MIFLLQLLEGVAHNADKWSRASGRHRLQVLRRVGVGLGLGSARLSRVPEVSRSRRAGAENMGGEGLGARRRRGEKPLGINVVDITSVQR